MPSRGFEPLIVALKVRCIKPLCYDGKSFAPELRRVITFTKGAHHYQCLQSGVSDGLCTRSKLVHNQPRILRSPQTQYAANDSNVHPLGFKPSCSAVGIAAQRWIARDSNSD